MKKIMRCLVIVTLMIMASYAAENPYPPNSYMYEQYEKLQKIKALPDAKKTFMDYDDIADIDAEMKKYDALSEADKQKYDAQKRQEQKELKEKNDEQRAEKEALERAENALKNREITFDEFKKQAQALGYPCGPDGVNECMIGTDYKGLTYEEAKAKAEKANQNIDTQTTQNGGVSGDGSSANPTPIQNGGSNAGGIDYDFSLDDVKNNPIEELKQKVFGGISYLVNNINCSYECRDVASDEYGTQIVGYDFLRGITRCRVFKKSNMQDEFSFTADGLNQSCATAAELTINELLPKIDGVDPNKISLTSSIAPHNPDEGGITLAKFFSSVATLNPEIVDRVATHKTGQLVLASGVNTRGQPSGKFEYESGIIGGAKDILTKIAGGYFDFLTFDKSPQPMIDVKQVNIADGFNKANLAYFSNLFENMSEIYSHLQNLLFIVVGGFYLSTMFGDKLLVYLQKRGASEQTEPNLHKFAIPLLAVGAFFMPIPEGSIGQGADQKIMSATAVQKVIRFATAGATDIADMASAIGAKTYMSKIYASVGSLTPAGEENVKIQYATTMFINQKAKTEYIKKCKERYGEDLRDGINLSRLSEKEKREKLEGWDNDNLAGTKKDVRFETCVWLQDQIAITNSRLIQLQAQVTAIDAYKANDELTKSLKGIDDYAAAREKEFGWINAIMLPGTAMMAEFQSYITKNVMQDDEYMKQVTEASGEALIEDMKKGKVDSTDQESGVVRAVVSWAIGKAVYMMFPSSSAIWGFFDSAYDKISSIASKIIGISASFVTTPIGGILASVAADIALSLGKPFAVFWLTTFIIEEIIKNIPIIVCTVASCIAFIGYFVTLTKYFYISPFVVAFSLSTKRLDKIVEFLITGITIFFKPVLIVLFIYLALFLHTIIREFFIFYSIEQFSALKVGGEDLLAIISIEVIKGMLLFFGGLASAYVVWKTILTGPDWVFKLLGLNNTTSDSVSDGLTRGLETRTFLGA